MKLYIANGTRQIQTFVYRLPETKQSRTQQIAIGGQIAISGDLPKASVDSIIGQYAKYGMIPADEVDHNNGPAPLCYSVGKPVTPEQIRILIDRNQGVLVSRGRKAREDAAVVTAAAIGKSVQEQGLGAELDSMEMTVTEDVRKGQTDAGAADESVVVEREGHQGTSRARNRGRGRGRE